MVDDSEWFVMQTPSDSEPDGGQQNRSADNDDNIDVRRRQPDRSISRRSSGSSNGEHFLRHPKRTAGRNVNTTETSKGQTLVIHKPSSAATRLRLELVAMIERTQRTGTWMNLVPARIGRSEAIDSGVKAIVKAVEHANLNTSVTEENCLGSYSKAIITLRDDMQKSVSSDDLLMTVALLVNFERVFSYSSVPLRSHMHGIVALLVGQARSRMPPTDLTRAVLYQFWAVAFIGPCVMGVPSPFDIPRWLEAEPVLLVEEELKAPWKVVLCPRQMANQLYIRLPRLIMLIKGVQADPNPERIDEAIRLAKELLEIENIDAESEVLHHVQINKTEDSESMPYSMTFNSIAEFEAAAHYWSTHIILYRLCWRLLGLFPTKSKELQLRPKAQLHMGTSRMAANIIMSARYGLTKGEVGESCMIMGLVSVWGALNDFDVFASRSIAPVRARMLLKQYGKSIMRPTGANPLDESGQRLEAAAELFAGGQSSGVLAFTFSRPASKG